MMRMRSFRFAMLLALAHATFSAGPGVATAQTAVEPHFRIEGVVVNQRDGSPLPRCRMTATMAGTIDGANRGQNRQAIEVQSDEHGRFAMEVPSAGKWRLAASGRNLHAQAYESHEGFFTGIALTREQPIFHVVFRAVADAVVSGFVVDEAGEAVRNAPVSLITVDPAAEEIRGAENARTQQAMTDDRGHYEFSGLDAGAYLVNVRARPWYALQGGPGNGSTTPGLDPSLDMVYPVTWYPGTTEDALATPLQVVAGDRMEADFHLLAMPSAHLLLPAPAQQPVPGQGGSAGTPGGGFIRGNAQVSLLLPNGGLQQVFGNYANAGNGEVDMGGLEPGTYQVTLPGSSPREPGRTTVLRIGAGGTVTEVGAGVADSTLTLSVDGDTSVDASQIALVDTATRRVIRIGNRRGRPGNLGPGGEGNPGRPRQGQEGIGAISGGVPVDQMGARTDGLRTISQSGAGREDPRSPAVLQLPPGRYEVTVPANAGVFLTGLTAKGAQAEGRFVTVRDGDASLIVHLAAGLASVDGIVSLRGKPAAGALVLLVPATLGASTSLATVHRDQSNTDGSYHLAGVVPGPYILLAIDHGWGVRWEDPATLRTYLLQGTPVELGAGAAVHSALDAVAP